ncbi:MAG: tRNA lysidine(34) synthetase TilS [Arcticibacter sp.]
MLPTGRLQSYISQNNLFGTTDRLLLGVSGGKDSVLMAHLFYAAGIQFGIAHCNFGLRGPESDGDEEFTRSLAGQLGVPFHTVRFNTKEHASAQQISIQMAARELRYSWFEEIRGEHGYQYIAVAQHKSDATETVLLNLIRGTGISGLHGILAKRDRIIRPLLFLSSEEISSIIADNGIDYREDSSNATVKYARNKIRHEVIPKMKELNKELDLTFEQNSRRFLQLETFLNHEVEKLRSQLFKPLSADTWEISIESLAALHPRELLLFELFRPYHFSETTLQDLAGAWNNQSGKIFESRSHTLLIDRHLLILKTRTATETGHTLISDDTMCFSWKDNRFTCRYASAEGLKFSGDSKIAYLDADLLQFPLKLRLWNQGDYFHPLGMKGRKKISDFFISQKLSRFAKEDVGILENGNGDILWIVGYRSDNRYRVSKDTKNIFIIEASE